MLAALGVGMLLAGCVAGYRPPEMGGFYVNVLFWLLELPRDGPGALRAGSSSD